MLHEFDGMAQLLDGCYTVRSFQPRCETFTAYLDCHIFAMVNIEDLSKQMCMLGTI